MYVPTEYGEFTIPTVPLQNLIPKIPKKTGVFNWLTILMLIIMIILIIFIGLIIAGVFNKTKNVMQRIIT